MCVYIRVEPLLCVYDILLVLLFCSSPFLFFEQQVVEDSSQRIEQILGEVAYFLESTKPESKLPTGETDPGTSVSHGNSQLTSPSEQEKRLLADIPPGGFGSRCCWG